MKRVIIIGIVSVLCFYAKAQENYPYRDISAYIAAKKEFLRDDSQCFFIQTREEFNKLCKRKGFSFRISGGDVIDFSKEFVLGVKVFTTYSRDNVPNFQYSITKEPKTGIIHFLVSHVATPTPYNRGTVQTWVAIQKPINDYEIHIHLNSWVDSEIRIYKNTQ